MTNAERPPLDAGFAPLLDMVHGPEARPMSSLTPAEARASFSLMNALAGPPVDGVDVEDRSIDGPAGDIAIRIVRPADGDPIGILCWFHGGGFVIGDLDTTDDTTRRLASATRCTVVSVDYRLAPEHPAPAAVEDCWAAVLWASENRTDLAADAAPIAVGGDSAGGNLAAVIARRAAAADPALAAQLLAYPAVALDDSHPSIQENGEGLFLTAETMAWFGEQYLSGGADPTDPEIAPIRADDDSLRAVAPAIVQVAGYDPLRDEGIAYAERLRSLGVTVDLREYPTMIHGFWGMITLTPVAAEAIGDAAALLATRFEQHTT